MMLDVIPVLLRKDAILAAFRKGTHSGRGNILTFSLFFAQKPSAMQPARPLVENLLAKGKLEAAIEACLLLARHHQDQERGSTVAQHSARFHTLMTDYHAGTLNDDDYRPERARINRAMLDFAHALPADWTDEALEKAGFSAQAYDKTSAPGQKSFLEKWGLVLGIVASLAAILGVTLKDVLFPEKQKEVLEQPKENPPTSAEVKPQEPTTTPAQKEAAGTSQKPAFKTIPSKQPEKSSEPVKSTREPQPTLATPDEQFRSFSKTKIVDDMERGYLGRKLAFRNVRTKEILCCYSDAEDFSGGKAYVSKDGVNYFYIDKKGNRAE